MNIFTIFFSQNFSKILSKTHHFKKFLEGACPQIYSLQRRRDRHMAIYMWKILEKSAQLLATYSVSYIRSLCHSNFRNRAATLFSCLPKHIRNSELCQSH